MIAKVLPWVLAVGLVVGWVKSYGDARAAQALALARFDSLQISDARVQELELARQELRDSLEEAVQAFNVERQALREVASRAERRSWANLARLEAVLADTASDPDTLAAIVRETVAGLEEERDVCKAELLNCDSVAEARRLQLFSVSESLVAKDSLLGAYRIQLQAAIRNQAKPAGLIRWAERGLAVVGILKVGEVLVDLVTNREGG